MSNPAQAEVHAKHKELVQRVKEACLELIGRGVIPSRRLLGEAIPGHCTRWLEEIRGELRDAGEIPNWRHLPPSRNGRPKKKVYLHETPTFVDRVRVTCLRLIEERLIPSTRRLREAIPGHDEKRLVQVRDELLAAGKIPDWHHLPMATRTYGLEGKTAEERKQIQQNYEKILKQKREVEMRNERRIRAIYHYNGPSIWPERMYYVSGSDT